MSNLKFHTPNNLNAEGLPMLMCEVVAKTGETLSTFSTRLISDKRRITLYATIVPDTTESPVAAKGTISVEVTNDDEETLFKGDLIDFTQKDEHTLLVTQSDTNACTLGYIYTKFVGQKESRELEMESVAVVLRTFLDWGYNKCVGSNFGECATIDYGTEDNSVVLSNGKTGDARETKTLFTQFN